MSKVVRYAYVREVRKTSRTEPNWPDTIVELNHSMPYSGRIAKSPNFEGCIYIPQDEKCPFKYGDRVKITIEV